MPQTQLILTGDSVLSPPPSPAERPARQGQGLSYLRHAWEDPADPLQEGGLDAAGEAPETGPVLMRAGGSCRV